MRHLPQWLVNAAATLSLSPSPPSLLEFTRLCQQWNTTDWSWLVAFKADMSLYKGDFESFRKILQHERQKAKTNEKDKVRELMLIFFFVTNFK